MKHDMKHDISARRQSLYVVWSGLVEVRKDAVLLIPPSSFSTSLD